MDQRLFENRNRGRLGCPAGRPADAPTHRNLTAILGGITLGTLLLVVGVAAISAPNASGDQHVAAGTSSIDLADVMLMSQSTGDCMRFIADANYPDNTSVQAGQNIDKAWRVQNCGSQWSAVQAVRVGGSYGPGSFGVTQAAPNQTFDVHAGITAPSGAGAHQRATYQLRGPRGNFGPTFWVELNVTASLQQAQPRPTAQLLNNCAKFLADVTYADNASVSTSQNIDKVWRLQNCGSDWNDTQAVRVSGSYGPSSFGIPRAGANQTVDVHAAITAPSTAGAHQRATYQLRDARGNFGPTFWVELNVATSPLHTPPQTPTAPAPHPQPQPQPALDQNRLNTIRGLYDNVLGRAADDAGLMNFYHSGLSERQIHDALLASPECQQANGGECRARRYDGALVQASGEGASFLLSGGQRHQVPDTGTYWTIYFSNGQRAYDNWSHSQVYGIPQGGAAGATPYPPADEGAIATDPDRHSYLLNDQRKHAIPDTQTYADLESHNNHRAYSYGWDRINRIPSGAAVPSVAHMAPSVQSLGCPNTVATARVFTCSPSIVGAVGYFRWSASGASPSSGTGASFATSFGSTGGQTISLEACNGDACASRSQQLTVNAAGQATVVQLDVPFQSQWDQTTKSGDANCGPASLDMILNFYGKSVSYAEAIKGVRADKKTGDTDFLDSASTALLNSHGLDYVRANGSAARVRSLRELKSQIDARHPIIMLVNNNYGRSLYANVGNTYDVRHIVVLTGYEADASGAVKAVFINDPLAIMKSKSEYVPDVAHGKNFRLAASDFEAAANKVADRNGWYGAAVVSR
jgi:hypothetical protein